MANRRRVAALLIAVPGLVLTAACGRGGFAPVPAATASPTSAEVATTSTTVPPEPRVPAMLTVTSDPPGADVEVGVKCVGSTVTFGTGRAVGATPLTVEVNPGDLATCAGRTNLITNVELAGHIPYSSTIDLGPNGQLAPGRTYAVDATLAAVPARLAVTSNPPGASVEVGVKCVGNVVTFGTGRQIGATPTTVDLTSDDLATCAGKNLLIVNVESPGYLPYSRTFDFGPNGGLEPGRTYSIDTSLSPA